MHNFHTLLGGLFGQHNKGDTFSRSFCYRKMKWGGEEGQISMHRVSGEACWGGLILAQRRYVFHPPINNDHSLTNLNSAKILILSSVVISAWLHTLPWWLVAIFLIIGSPHTHSKLSSVHELLVGKSTIKPSQCVRNLGVVFDKQVSMVSQVTHYLLAYLMINLKDYSISKLTLLRLFQK